MNDEPAATARDANAAPAEVGLHILLTGNTAFKLANFRIGLIRRLRNDGHRLTVLAPKDGHVDILVEVGCEVEDLRMDRKSMSPATELPLLYAFWRAMRRHRPDVVFSYTIKNNLYGALCARVLGIPFVPNVTGLGTAFNGSGALSRLMIAFYRSAFRNVPVVFFQNDHDRDLFVGAGIVKTERSRLLPGSGVDLEAFDVRPLPAAEEAGPVFLLIARMLRDKGIGEFAAAARILREEFPAARFQLLGPIDPDSRAGIDRATLDEWVDEGSVEYLGAVRDVRPAIAAADCVVLPSYYREGTPRALLEAAAMGRPIVTTDMPGCRDVVVDGLSGFLCEPRSVESLAEAMRRVISAGPAARAAMGSAGRARMAERYDERIVIDAYMEVIAGLSMSRPRSAALPRP